MRDAHLLKIKNLYIWSETVPYNHRKRKQKKNRTEKWLEKHLKLFFKFFNYICNTEVLNKHI